MATTRSRAVKSPITITADAKEEEASLSKTELAQLLRELKEQRSVTVKDLLEALAGDTSSHTASLHYIGKS